MVTSPPSIWERIGRAVAYVFTALIGVGAVVFPHGYDGGAGVESTTERLGAIIWIWALFMATALPAALATYFGRHRVEYILIPLFTVALLVANVNAWVNTVYLDNSMMARACASSALVCLLAVRWLALHRINKTPFPWTLIKL